MASQAFKSSERQPMAGARSVGPARPDERLEVSILLKRQGAVALNERRQALLRGDRSARLSRAEFAAMHGHAPADAARVRAFAERHGLVVVEESAARSTIVVSGTVAQFNAAFGVSLQYFEHAGGSYRGRIGTVNLSEDISDAIEAVLGLDNRPQASPHFRVHQQPGNVRWHKPAAAAPVSYTPLQVAALYGFPAATGAGQTIGIIELGGGFRTADLKAYFNSLGVAAPTVTAVSVDQAKNQATGSPDGPDGEVMLDIEVAAAIAPAASIVVYFAPNTDAGFLDAVTTAIHDTTNKPSVVSISWGGPESSWTAQAMNALSQAISDGAALGVTVCVASGDNGSSDGVTDGANHVDFPASSPFSLACGGTNLQGQGTQVTGETVWNDGAGGGAGGGGVSATFALPTWQNGLVATTSAGQATALSMRGVPDVCGDADPESGYQVRVDGQNTVVGGTSAVAPLWAALIARLNSIDGTAAGFINPLLYANATALNDVTSGNNGAFAATSGWDAASGLGSPNGAKLAALFASSHPSTSKGRS